MKRSSAMLLCAFLFINACGQSTPPADTPAPVESIVTKAPAVEVLPTVTPACVSPEPTQTDIDRVLGYTGNIFNAPSWEKSFETYDNKVAVYWVSAEGVAFLENVIFPCGYEEPDLDRYFSDEHWDVVFGNYEDYSLVNECHNDNGLRLYEFSVSDQGINYDVRYWATYDSNNSIITLMLLLPASSTPVMDEYSALLFSRLSSCQ